MSLALNSYSVAIVHVDSCVTQQKRNTGTAQVLFLLSRDHPQGASHTCKNRTTDPLVCV